MKSTKHIKLLLLLFVCVSFFSFFFWTERKADDSPVELSKTRAHKRKTQNRKKEWTKNKTSQLRWFDVFAFCTVLLNGSRVPELWLDRFSSFSFSTFLYITHIYLFFFFIFVFKCLFFLFVVFCFFNHCSLCSTNPVSNENVFLFISLNISC